MRSDSSSCVIQSDSGFGNCRRRPVRGSRRASCLFHTQRPMYFSLSKSRLMVAGDQPLLVRILPGTASMFSIRTIRMTDSPRAYAWKTRRMTAASPGRISNLYPSGLGRPFLSSRAAPTGTDVYP